MTLGGSTVIPLPFYSRRIGLDASGNRQDVDLGVKATGRLGQYRLGFLNTKMNGSGEIDGENLGVLRLRTDVLRESTAGLIMTWGDPAGGRATTAGVDFNWRRSDLEDGGTATGKCMGPSSPTTKTVLVVLSAASCRTQATRSRFVVGWRLLEGFDPKLGFVRVPEADEWFYGIYRARRPSNPLIRRVRVGMFGSIYDEIRPNVRFDRMTFEPLELQSERGRSHQRQVGAVPRAIGRRQSNRRCFGRRWRVRLLAGQRLMVHAKPRGSFQEASTWAVGSITTVSACSIQEAWTGGYERASRPPWPWNGTN